MSNRRGFLRRGIAGLLGTALSLVVLPQLGTSPTVEVSAMGDKQLRLLLASKALVEKAGMLRASSISHYLSDTGEIEMDWSVSIPPEQNISQQIDNLAKQVLALVNQ